MNLRKLLITYYLVVFFKEGVGVGGSVIREALELATVSYYCCHMYLPVFSSYFSGYFLYLLALPSTARVRVVPPLPMGNTAPVLLGHTNAHLAGCPLPDSLVSDVLACG